MIAIDDTLISEHIFEKDFVCDLNQCKGQCCIDGDAGAPLEEEELALLNQNYNAFESYMSEEGKLAVAQHGKYVIDEEGDYVTPLVDGKECAYVVFNDSGHALCAIEQAFRDKKIDFIKPLSCHLYPIRIVKYKDYDAINFAHWDICHSAYECGKKNGIKTYQFTKEALIRKYGEAWYEQLEQYAK